MSPDQILRLLEMDEELRKFIVSFHERLALDNPGRDVATALTEEQRVMDSLGRLLVGDEVCAAVAADGTHFFVSSNSNNHSPAQAKFLFDSVIFTADADAKYISAVGRVKASFLLDYEVSHTLPELSTFYLGKYEYKRAEHKLVLLDRATQKFEIPYSKHGIDQYPLPIGCSFDPLLEIASTMIEPIVPNGTVELRSFPGSESVYISRLDPLFRRSAVVFSHLGLLCAMGERWRTNAISPELVKEALAASATNRRSVMKQTLGWEVAKWYKLDKEKRSHEDYAKLSKKNRVLSDIKRKEILDLENFIEALTDDVNAFLSHIAEPKSLKPLVKRWEAQARARIYNGKIMLPGIINNSKHYPLDRFLELVSTHFKELFLLEQYVVQRSTRNPNLLTYTLTRVGQREMLGQSTDGMLEMVDENLSEGTHAEVRLFSRFNVQECRSPDKMPYFGITQLCCASCNTLFKSHGLRYDQGSVRRAGTHGTHYPGWKLDAALQIDKVLKPFLGNALFARFKHLYGDIVFEGKSASRQKWAFNIIEDLATLWFKAEPNRLARITALGFTHGGIACDESNYPDFDGHVVPYQPVEKPQVNYASISDFRRALIEGYGLEITTISGDGDCQFRAGARSLRFLDPVRYRQLVSGVEGGFTFFHEGQREQLATNAIRRVVVQHMRDHEDDFLPFLVEEGSVHFDAVNVFADYMDNDFVYGNNLTLRAMVLAYQRPIIVLRPGTPAAPVAVHAVPVHQGDIIDINSAIILVYNGEDHYDVVLHEPNQILGPAFCKLVDGSYEVGVMYALKN